MIDIGHQAARFFDDSSLSRGQTPKLVVISGGVCAGKTTVRRSHYSTGFVVVDAADIFLNSSSAELERGGS
jgi:predicted ATPase